MRLVEPTTLPITFRPPIALRLVVGVFSALSLVGAVALIVGGKSGSLFLALLLQIGLTLVGVVILRRYVRVNEETLEVSTLFGSKAIPWEDVLALEQTRRAFVVVTTQGNVSAGLLVNRERLQRLIMQYARLRHDPQPTRWGIVARYVQTGKQPVQPLIRIQLPDRSKTS
jgi:hypothetical protein